MKNLLTMFFLVLLTNFVAAQVTKTINVSIAGTLSSLLNNMEDSTITNLTVTGNIDARDVKCMRDEMTVLEILDIRNVNVVFYEGNDGTRFSSIGDLVYPANQMPKGAFFYGYGTGKALKTIILPNSITSIGDYAFYGCQAITEITIPNSVTTINMHAFLNCSGLKVIKCLNSTPPTLETDCFSGVTPTVVYVPVGMVATYKADSGWNTFNNIKEYILTVSTLPVSTITTSAKLNASIDVMPLPPVSAHGFCWNTVGSPTLADNIINNGSKTTEGNYSSTLSNLTIATTYYVRAYATDAERTVFGSEFTFSTASLPDAAGLISGIQNPCQGQTSVTYTVPTITNATSYTWTLPAGITGTSTTNSITVSYSRTVASGNIIVKGHNEWGDGTMSSLVITVSPLPSDAGTISGSTSVCQGESAVTYSVPAIENATSYIWALPSGVSGTSSTNNISVNYGKTSISGNITVKGHNGCGDGIVYVLPITVNQLPVVSGTDKSVICGDPVSLYATTDYTGSGNLIYKWTPTTGLNNDAIVNPTSTVTSDITYTVTITTPNGCLASANIKVSILPMTKPEIGIVGVSSSNKNNIIWNKPPSIGIASYYIYKETNISDVYEKIGTVPYESLSVFVDEQSAPDVKSNKYEISIFDCNGQESPLSDAHKTMHLSINKGQNNTWNLIWEPYEGFMVSTYNIYRGTNANSLNFLDATSGNSTQYSDISAPVGDVYYQLEVISPKMVSPTKAPASIQNSNYTDNTIEFPFASYNSSRSNIASSVFNSINVLTVENDQISIYPNPVKEQFSIDFKGGSTFEILNLMGKVIYNGDLNKSAVVQSTILSKGAYIIKFKNGNTFEYRKIIKE
jgi:hypothetical protein